MTPALWAGVGLWVLRRCHVHYTVGALRYRMPLALAFPIDSVLGPIALLNNNK